MKTNPSTYLIEPDNGLFSMMLSNGDLRKVHIHGKEIIQRIYFAVRDKEWLTIPFYLENFQENSEGSKQIFSFSLIFKKEEIDFETKLSVILDENKLVVEAVGKAATNFLKNRIGLCLLLPASLKKTPCKVIHTDKSVTQSILPKLISPHQPFKNISEIELTLKTCKATILFEGDIFEMEDQRNWTDASYKIYSTPLEIPFPVAVKKGDIFSQKITLTISEYPEKYNSISSGYVGETNTTIIPPPMIGIDSKDYSSNSDLKLVSDKLDTVFSYARVDFHLYNKKWRKNLAIDLKKSIIAIYASLYFSHNYKEEIIDFIDYLKKLPYKLTLQSIVLFSNELFVLPDSILVYLVSLLRNSFPDTPIGAGTDANFAQLNRNRPNSEMLDFICYSIQPQEHASDALSIIENLQAQSDTVETALSFSNESSVHISSLSIFRRFNANIDVIVKENNICDRNKYAGTNFEAAWFIGSLNQLINAGVKAITCTCSLQTETPLFKFFRYMTLHPPEIFYTCESLLPEKYALLSWEKRGKRHSVFANLTAEPISIMHHFAEMKLGAYEISYVESDKEIVPK